MDIQRLLILIVLSIVGPVGVLLNIIIIITLVKNKLLTSRTYLIYANLAFCDVINASLGCVLGISIYSTGEFVFCKCLLVETVMVYTTSVAVIAFLSYDRYLMLRSPLSYTRIMTGRFTACVLVIIWLVSVLNATLLLTKEAIQPITDRYSLLNRKNCVITRLVVREYLITWSFVIIIFPMLTTIVTNTAILRIASAHHRSLTTRCANFNNNNNNNKTATTTIRDWNIKAALTTVRIVATSVLCTLPFVCVILIEALCEYCVPYKTMRPFYALFLLNFCSTVVNPIVYTLTNKELKRRVMRLVRESVVVRRCFAQKQQAMNATSLSVVSYRNSDIKFNIVNSKSSF